MKKIMELDKVKGLVKLAKERLEKSTNKEEVKKIVSEAIKVSKRAKGSFAADEDTQDDRVLITKSTTDPKIKALQQFNDEAYLLSRILKRDVRSLKYWAQHATSESELRKAMDTAASAEGGSWVPTGFSADLIDRVRLELKVAALFSRIDMPRNPYELPIVASDAIAYLVAENTADVGTKISASTPGTGKVTLSAVKLGARVLFSEELDEDSIIPIMPFLRENITAALSGAWEDATINGDTAGTHQDSDVTSASDRRKAFDGLRKMCQSGNKVSLATFNLENMRTIRKKLGKYGVIPTNLAWITGTSGYMQLLGLEDSSGNQVVTTVDKYGPNATILSGELAKLDGIPVVVSEYVREDLNASGVYDGTTTTRTLMVLVYRGGFIYGDRRRITMKTDEDIETDQQLMVCTQRLDFEDRFDASTNNTIALGYNLTS